MDLVLTIAAREQLVHGLLIRVGQVLAVRARADAVDRVEAWLVQHGARALQDCLESQTRWRLR